MSHFAERTEVEVSKSIEGIRRELKRFGATGFAPVEDWQTGAFVLVFRLGAREYRVPLPTPDRHDPRFLKKVNQYVTSGEFNEVAYEQACRSAARAVFLYIKAILVAVDAGIVSYETALLPYALLPDGRTSVGEWAEEQIAEAIREHRMPLLMPGMSNRLLPPAPLTALPEEATE